jgi:dephospho-CoA kinase
MIIGLSGYAQTGKDTVAEHLTLNYGYRRVAFADPIRQALYRLNPVVPVGEFQSTHLAQAVNGLGWEETKRLSPETRRLLQVLGTEVGRDMFGPDFWVNQAMGNASKFDKIVLTDVRYPNEYRAIKNRDGILIRIVKPGTGAVNEHSSETALDNFSFDATIVNDGSIYELSQKIDSLMKERA